MAKNLAKFSKFSVGETEQQIFRCVLWVGNFFLGAKSLVKLSPKKIIALHDLFWFEGKIVVFLHSIVDTIILRKKFFSLNITHRYY